MRPFCGFRLCTTFRNDLPVLCCHVGPVMLTFHKDIAHNSSSLLSVHQFRPIPPRFEFCLHRWSCMVKERCSRILLSVKRIFCTRHFHFAIAEQCFDW